jgi:protein-S-isoprenylcysteine O-methyltransferase Ste14
MGAGTMLYIGTLGIIILGVILTAFLWVKLTKEEEILMKEFPQKYPAYKMKSKALIPFLI